MERQDNFTEQIATRVSRDLRERLEALAAADKRPLANYIRLVLEQHVAEKTEAEAA
jgi:predicted DNA-binding protein